MVDCDCPYCGSRNTKAFPVLHGDGTRTSDYRKEGWSYRRRSVGIYGSRAQGRSQSLTAQLTAPPVPPTLTAGGVAIILIVGALLGGTTGFWIGVGLAVLLAVAGSDATDHQKRLREWQSTFRCGRCGTVFMVVECEKDSDQCVITVGAEPEPGVPLAHTAARSLLAGNAPSAQSAGKRTSDSAGR